MKNQNPEIINGCSLYSFVMPNCDFLGATLRVGLCHEKTDTYDCREITFKNYVTDDCQVLNDINVHIDNELMNVNVHFWDFSEEEQNRVIYQHRDEFVNAHRQFLRSTFKWDHVRTDKEQKLVNFLIEEINFFKCEVDKNSFLDWFLVGANALNDHDHYEMAKSETWTGQPLFFNY